MFRLARRGALPAAAFLLASFLVAPPAQASIPSDVRPELEKQRSVPLSKVPVKPLPDDAAMKVARTGSPEITWPRGTAEVPAATAAGRARAGALPVFVGSRQGASVEIHDRAAAERAGIDGFLMSVRQAGGDAADRAAPAAVEVDYSGFRDAYGGDWAARLRLLAYPSCVLTSPDVAACRTGKALGSVNTPATSRVGAQVGAGDTVIGVSAAPSGSTGSYTATPLSPSATWQVSAQTGDFNWSYPLRVPPSVGGPAPQVGITYSSGGVDGRTASTNTQPTWLGEGFDFWPGYIERKYKSCSEDGVTPKTGDQCWASQNATMVLNGGGGELIRDDATGTWRLKSDDGSTIKQLRGASNGDDDGEHWLVTTPDGTRYYFGLNQLPGWTSATGEETSSTWTAPVFGDDSGEPCHQSSYADSWCKQAWRWNLDYVVDPSGNAMSYYYGKETNRYARNLKTGTAYDRGGYLKRIDYGERDGQVYAGRAPAKVEFTVAGRCVPGSACDEKITKDWPDVPLDQKCTEGDCPEKYAPTFWTTKRLAGISTHVLQGSGYREVESWAFQHAFPKPGDGTSPALWLESITHKAGAASMPPINFNGVQLKNRVDGLEGLPPLYKWRVGGITTETGGQVSVTYAPTECAKGAPDTNTKRCFPQQWVAPEGGDVIKDDWFHKYVVQQVDQIDRTGGSPDQRTTYEYVGGGAWHYNEDVDLVPSDRKTWADWRGYGKVRVRQGVQGQTQSMTEFLYFRGMDGDKLSSGTRDVKVTDSDGVQVEDHRAYRGQVREEITYNGPGGAVVSRSVNDLWRHGPTAKHESAESYVVRQSRMTGYSALSGGGFRKVEVAKSFDTLGLVTQIDDRGDTATDSDDQCVRYEYARNIGKTMLKYVNRVESVGVRCTITPQRPAQVLSDVRTYYDGATTYTAQPARGLVTKVEELSETGYVTTSGQEYDAYGRILRSTDALGYQTAMAYTPASGGLVTEVRTTNPLGHVATTYLDAGYGQPTAEVDANLRRTDLEYDPLGRLTKVWLPGRSKSAYPDNPSGEYSYLVRQDGPVSVTTKSIKADGGYAYGFELYDGFLRLRQSQVATPRGGRALADTQYDSRGFVAKRNTSYFNSQPPGTVLWEAADNAVPAQTVFVRDGAGRTTAEVFRSDGAERWRTTIESSADWTTITPPAGSARTATLTDARGRVAELRQFAASGAYDRTTYSYTPDGELASTTDPAGNVRTYTYDMRGRLTGTKDPDRGVTSMTYDVAGRLLSTLDARQRRLTYTYDALGRTRRVDEGATKLAEWTYDTLLKGLSTSSTRYVGGQAYTTAVTGYDSANRPLGSKTTIPASEGALAGTYQFGLSYYGDGSVSKIRYPAAGGLPAEEVTLEYDPLGLPSKLTGAVPYVTETLYTEFAEPAQYEMASGTNPVYLTSYYETGTRRLARARVDRSDPVPKLSDVDYAYDPAGNVTRIRDAIPGDTQCFSYDHLRRVTDAWTATDACSAAPSASVVGGPQSYWDTYTYDKTGNRLTQVRHGTTGNTTSTYTPSADGQPHTLDKVVTSGPAGDRLDRYVYDPAGNMTLRDRGGVEQRMDWDAEGHLATSTEAGKVTSFVYNADGDRLLKREPTGSTLSLGLMELRQDAATGKVSGTRYYTLGQAQAVRTQQGVAYLTGDHQGTNQIAVDAATLKATERKFTPFGEARGAAPQTWPDEKGFVGGEQDASTGLTHLGAREYDPEAGRFISADPVADVSDPQQLHGYAYASNSPVTFDDASGLMLMESDGGGGGGGGGGSSSAPPGDPGGGGPSQDQVDQAKYIKNKSFLSVVVEVGAEILLEVLGINDIVNCVSGDIGACVSMVVGALPWGKIFKAPKIAKGIGKLAKGFMKWMDDLKWADDVIKQADDAAAAAAKKGDDVASGAAKSADDAAETATKSADPPSAVTKGDDVGGSPGNNVIGTQAPSGARPVGYTGKHRTYTPRHASSGPKHAGSSKAAAWVNMKLTAPTKATSDAYKTYGDVMSLLGPVPMPASAKQAIGVGAGILSGIRSALKGAPRGSHAWTGGRHEWPGPQHRRGL
ncbi:type IV secretion protein Rhs [Nonomuraea sp. NBC_01738]|uniref:RHS repeat domain-containing protein n=1 Tax=Nonomuraea sp. NBC_01738 TaxID=2976003 RepID=UPI002E1180C1|nr:type IV secretion protein Rhs [Nonomuraea sp. NBC_01738]